MDTHDVAPTDWLSNDATYYDALQAGFDISGINIEGTEKSSSFDEFVENMQHDLSNNGMEHIANEFNAMIPAFPYTVMYYKGVVSSVATTTGKSGGTSSSSSSSANGKRLSSSDGSTTKVSEVNVAQLKV